MAKLLCAADWPEAAQDPAPYPLEFVLAMQKTAEPSSQWLACQAAVLLAGRSTDEKKNLIEKPCELLPREISRLADDLNSFSSDQRQTTLTFTPIAPSFELWINRLSGEQYRAIVWFDLAAEFQGVSNIGYQGARFMTNRARLMGFVRSLESDLAKVSS